MISVRNLEKHFGSVQVLKGISTDIYTGERVVIIGPSGSGKSTFLRCLNCLEDPTGGSVIFENEDLADTKVNINIHRQNMGMVFQQFNLFNNLTVLENITLAPMKIFCKQAKKKHGNVEELKVQIKANAMSLLERIGLADKANVYPSTLSGGQKQRIAIVRAL
ncbi:MAG: ATP-binding cassette domain-containing protein, partial [Clostridia bacterium]|nr:ATP-binding cassette domain-containing protein [Clostridia bacterium]